MAQHDYNIANGTGAAVRSDLNNALSAIVTNNSGATEPATMYAYQWWADTTTGLLKIRNAANNGWVTVGTLASANLGLLTSAGTLTAALGSASTPGITFTGDTNTGIYSPGADQVAVATGGTGRLFVDSSGNITVGTTTAPGSNGKGLALYDASFPRLSFRNSTTGDANTDGTQILMNGNNFIISNTENGYTSFENNGAERLRITSGGLVGIGTTSPGQIVTVQSPTSGTAPTLKLQNPVDAGSSQGAANNLSAGQLLFGATGSYPLTAKIESLYSGDASFGRSSSLIFSTSDGAGGISEKFRCDASGRLLVGTSSGTGNNLLQVKGSTLGAGYPGGAFFNIGLNVASVDSNFELGRIDFGNQEGYLGASIVAAADLDWNASDYPSRLVFSTTADGASSPTERQRIGSNGQNSQFFSSTYGCVVYSSQAAGTSVYNIWSGYGASDAIGTGGTVSFRVSTNGNVQNTNNSYGAISDAKLKENIVDAGSQWDDLKAFQIRRFNFKEGQTHTQIGLIAQEAEIVSPGLVYESPDRDEDGNDLGTVTKSVNYSVLYMKAVKALQEAMERIEQLEAKVAALEAS